LRKRSAVKRRSASAGRRKLASGSRRSSRIARLAKKLRSCAKRTRSVCVAKKKSDRRGESELRLSWLEREARAAVLGRATTRAATSSTTL
jgi:hypothetical protein